MHRSALFGAEIPGSDFLFRFPFWHWSVSSPETRFRFWSWYCPSLELDSESDSETEHAKNSNPILRLIPSPKPRIPVIRFRDESLRVSIPGRENREPLVRSL